MVKNRNQPWLDKLTEPRGDAATLAVEQSVCPGCGRPDCDYDCDHPEDFPSESEILPDLGDK